MLNFRGRGYNLIGLKREKLTVNAGAGANLVLPLGGHDLSVDTGDVDTGVQAGTVVGLDDVTAVDPAGTNTTVVRTLGTGETTTGPAVGPAIGTEESVLLLETEPELLLGVGLHQAGGIVAVVELVGAAISIPGLAENEDVVTLAEGVGEDSDGAQVDVGVVTGGLAGGGTVEVPFGELLNRLAGLGEGLEWGRHTVMLATVSPDQVVHLPIVKNAPLSLSRDMQMVAGPSRAARKGQNPCAGLIAMAYRDG